MKKSILIVIVIALSCAICVYKHKDNVEVSGNLIIENIAAFSDVNPPKTTVMCVSSFSSSETAISTAYKCADGSTMYPSSTPATKRKFYTVLGCPSEVGLYDVNAYIGSCIK